MDRLFSKLQLDNIKVGENSSFPPDAEPYKDQQPPQASVAEPQDAEAAVQAPDASPNGEDTAAATAATEADAATEDEVVNVNSRPYRPGYGQGVPENRGEILKVSSRSRPSAVAGAIAGVVRENGRAEVQAIGAGAANQAIKAVAIARDYLNETGIEAICLPSLVDLTIDEADRTAIRLVIEHR